VCAETHIPCNACYQCTHGVPHICQKMGLFGHGVGTLQGGCAQYAVVRTDALYKLKTNLPAHLGALMEPFGVSHHAVEEVGVAGDDLLVIGCGPIGLFAIAIAKAMGATKVIACDILELRLNIAKQLGCDVVIDIKDRGISYLKERVLEETSGNGIGCVLECSGAPDLVNGQFSLMRKGGRCVLVGLPKAPLHVDNVLQDFIFRSITVKTIHGRKMFHTWEEAEKLIQKVNIEPVISHDLPMSQFEDAFGALLSGSASKILMDPHA